MDAVVGLVRETFSRARQTNARAVAIFQQADMFDPSYQPTWDVSAFVPLVQALVEESSTYDGEVYLFDGDSHVYNVDNPLAPGSRWLDVYDVEGSADNLTRITVDGEANNTNFLEVTVNRPGAATVLSWQRAPTRPEDAGHLLVLELPPGARRALDHLVTATGSRPDPSQGAAAATSGLREDDDPWAPWSTAR